MKKKTKKLGWEKRQQMGVDLIDSLFQESFASYLADMRNNTNDEEFFEEVSRAIYNFIITLTGLLGEMATTIKDDQESMAIAFRANLIAHLNVCQFHQLLDAKAPKKRKAKK